MTELSDWQNTEDIQNTEWTFRRYLVEKGEAKHSRKQGEREKRRKGQKQKNLKEVIRKNECEFQTPDF